MCMLLHCAATQWCANATCSPRERLQTHAEHLQCTNAVRLCGYTLSWRCCHRLRLWGTWGSDLARASTGDVHNRFKYCSAIRHQPAWHLLRVLSACIAYACR